MLFLSNLSTKGKNYIKIIYNPNTMKKKKAILISQIFFSLLQGILRKKLEISIYLDGIKG